MVKLTLTVSGAGIVVAEPPAESWFKLNPSPTVEPKVVSAATRPAAQIALEPKVGVQPALPHDGVIQVAARLDAIQVNAYPCNEPAVT